MKKAEVARSWGGSLFYLEPRKYKIELHFEIFSHFINSEMPGEAGYLDSNAQGWYTVQNKIECTNMFLCTL